MAFKLVLSVLKILAAGDRRKQSRGSEVQRFSAQVFRWFNRENPTQAEGQKKTRLETNTRGCDEWKRKDKKKESAHKNKKQTKVKAMFINVEKSVKWKR